MAPKPGELMSGVPRLLRLSGVANCAWLKRLNTSTRKFNPIPSQGRANCLIKEKSVLTKSGPDRGARVAVPNWPGVACRKAQGLNQFSAVCTLAGATQPGLALTGPATLGLPTMSGRVRLAPLLFRKPAPEALLLSTMKTGKPEVILSMRVTCQLPRMLLTGPFHCEPHCLPLPKGKS